MGVGHVPPTVQQWVRLLLAQIEEQARYAKPNEKRYRNEYTLPWLLKEYQEVYGSRGTEVSTSLRPPKTGAAAIGVDALTERLTILGAQSDNAQLVKKVEAAWLDCDLDVMHREAHREALIKARSFVQIARSTDGRAVVGIDAAEQMAVHRESGPPYDVDAALKVSQDEWTGKRRLTLWLPGKTHHLIEGDAEVVEPKTGVRSRWVVESVENTGLSFVPVVEISHEARLLVAPVSEIEKIDTLADVLDLIEGLMVFAGHFGAVPIRYATGLVVPTDPKDPKKPLLGSDGKPLIGFNPRADHLWASTSPDTKFGQLTPAGLGSFVEWADHCSRLIRARTKVASTYYSADLKSHMSAELLKTDEAPMVRRIRSIGENGSLNASWRRVMRIIQLIEEPGSSKERVSPRWADPETRIDSQSTDSFQKVVASGMGVRTAAVKYLGWSPVEVDRAIAEHEAAKDRQAAREAVANDPLIAALGKPLVSGDPLGVG